MSVFSKYHRATALAGLLALLFLLPGTAAAAEQLGKLFVETSPRDAFVKFVRLEYRYKPGIVLKEGRYIIEVSKPGFEPVLKQVDVFAGQDNIVYVDLANPTGGGSSEVTPGDKRIPLEDTISGAREPAPASPQPQAEEEEEPAIVQRSRLFDEAVGKKPRRSEPEEPVEPAQPAPAPVQEPAPVEPPVQAAPDLQYQAPADQPYTGQLAPGGDISQPPQSGEGDLVIPGDETIADDQAAEGEAPPALPDSGEPPSPEELMQVANHLTQAGDLPNAIQGFTLVLQQQPENVNAYVGRGFAYYKLGNYPYAVQDLTKAIELDEMNLSALFHRGNALLMQGEIGDALADYERALELNQSVPDLFNAHGTALYNLGDLQGAVHDFDVAIRLDPNYVDAYFNRGSAYAKMNKHQLALDDFNKVLELAPGDEQAMKRKKDMEKALRP